MIRMATHRVVVAPFKDKTGDYTLTLRAAEPRASDPEGVTDQYIRANLGDHPLAPGAAVAIVKEGEIIFWIEIPHGCYFYKITMIEKNMSKRQRQIVPIDG